MHAVFFEMRPRSGHLVNYFGHVAKLKPALARHPGIAFLDRYTSLSDADVLLSHQLWESEDAIAAWRADANHRRSQSAGRHVHFADYRIRVGERVSYWEAGMAGMPSCSAYKPGRQHVIALYGRLPIAQTPFLAFGSVNNQGRFIALTETVGSASHELLANHIGADGLDAAAVYAISRDYSQIDRSQAPR